MQAITTDTGVVLGSWLFAEGAVPRYVGPKYLDSHYHHADSRFEPEDDETMTPEQNAATREILEELGR